ncbi:hypothetical protein [Clostridium estertheticum]|nr:hypothetical protein [Clostridium estertheticum]
MHRGTLDKKPTNEVSKENDIYIKVEEALEVFKIIYSELYN